MNEVTNYMFSLKTIKKHSPAYLIMLSAYIVAFLTVDGWLLLLNITILVYLTGLLNSIIQAENNKTR